MDVIDEMDEKDAIDEMGKIDAMDEIDTMDGWGWVAGSLENKANSNKDDIK